MIVLTGSAVTSQSSFLGSRTQREQSTGNRLKHNQVCRSLNGHLLKGGIIFSGSWRTVTIDATYRITEYKRTVISVR